MDRTTNFNDVRMIIKEFVDIMNQDDSVEADNPICAVDKD